MGLRELKEELEQDVKAIVNSEFKVEVSETAVVPTIDSERITYPNLDSKEMKALKIKTCVLYIDIRKSTELNLLHTPKTLTKLYAAFMRSMVKAAQQYSGHVRNIIGDRVMVIFDEENCFTNAVNTAILLNSVGQYIIDKNFVQNDVKFGIGIDYGEILVSKGGIRKNGENNAPYKSLVWLGRPANVASKLTDLANKRVDIEKHSKEDFLEVMYWYTSGPLEHETYFTTISFSKFYNEEIKNYPGIKILQSKSGEPYFAYYSDTINKTYTPYSGDVRKLEKINTPKILMTSEVFIPYKELNIENSSIQEGRWKEQDVNLYKGYILYGSNLVFTRFKN